MYQLVWLKKRKCFLEQMLRSMLEIYSQLLLRIINLQTLNLHIKIQVMVLQFQMLITEVELAILVKLLPFANLV